MLRRLPKWLYVVLAVAFYLGLHQLVKVMPEREGLAQLGLQATYWAQYVVPGLLLLAALFLGRGDIDRRRDERSAIYRTKGSMGEDEHSPIIKVDPFRKMSEDEFRQLITQFFIGNGFKVEPTPPGLGDGVDLMLSKKKKTYVAQYRHWRELRVSVPMVREQYTVMQAARVNGVYVITTGEFSYKAIQFAEDKNISLIDGLKLRRLMKKNAPEHGSGLEASPLCPLCAAEMQIRTGKDQNGKDRRFWSCSNYPKCSGTRKLAPR